MFFSKKDELSKGDREVVEWVQEIVDKFKFVFLEKDRWMFITDGLKVTLMVTFLALLLGLIIGMVVAVIRTSYNQLKRELRGVKKVLFSILDGLCGIYLTIIRGTPVLVQLLLMYFVILVYEDSKLVVAVATFGINSGAYVAEIFRSGIMSIDKGQMEAGRSLGLSYVTTMTKVILPQAIKNVLPALVNEIITLLKETSICGYIGLNELTRGGDIIRGATFEALFPLLMVALIYLVIVMIFTALMSKIERRLRESDLR
ncbi:MAG: amino acid ABC transporter permease [Lachnospiraceae bacterium]|nr:amino acid ABC transporter permease [Lachnospiraceae bacterium]